MYLLESGATPRAKTNGSFDMDTMLHKALYQVTSMLLPLPAGTKRKTPGKSSSHKVHEGKGSHPHRGGRGKGQGSNKGKGKGASC